MVELGKIVSLLLSLSGRLVKVVLFVFLLSQSDVCFVACSLVNVYYVVFLLPLRKKFFLK